MRNPVMTVCFATSMVAVTVCAFGGTVETVEDVVPRIVRSAMDKHDCRPIRSFYERDEVYLPSFAYLDSWNGQSLIAFACEGLDNSQTYKIVLTTPKSTVTAGVVKEVLAAATLNCPSEIPISEAPFGLALALYTYDPTEQYGEEHVFRNFKNTHKATFLVVEDMMMWGTGRGYLCLPGKWQWFDLH